MPVPLTTALLALAAILVFGGEGSDDLIGGALGALGVVNQAIVVFTTPSPDDL